ncbi:MAG: protein-glutamate O-methyltransferase CheR [Desulfobacteraceae bacterium]|nr:MAG: protein-glutamate O-methyltransferase CheR [Desulfobacteraceae bacterium]
MGLSLSHNEFLLMQKYISEQCGILIPEEKAYLIESRLAKLLAESGAKSFAGLYHTLRNQGLNKSLPQKVIDAITTKETRWFRDKTPWYALEDVLLPRYIREIRQAKRPKVRIWSAACATGQEPYSIAMCIDNYINQRGITDIKLSHFEILATDISQAALQTARSGKYDHLSIARGLDDTCRARYLKQEGRVWALDEKLKEAVRFQQFNLRNSYLSLGKFDIVFCRYVMIYFSEAFKQELRRKIISVLNPEGVLFLGSSEIYTKYKEHFELVEYKGGIHYRLKKHQE